MTRTTDRDWNDHLDPEDWTAADDELIRSALMTLRDDVDTVPLSDPAFIRARYGETRRRRRAVAWVAGAAAAGIVIGGVALSQLGDPEASRLDPAQTTTTEAVTTEPTTAPTQEPSDSPTTEAPTAEPSETGTDTVITVPTSGETIEPCGAIAGSVNLEGVSEEAGAKALGLMEAALGCHSETLVSMATVDQTELSFGMVTPEDAFDLSKQLPGENRYELLSRLLTLTPEQSTVDGDSWYRWPAEPTSDADWQSLIDAHVISAEERQIMEGYGSGYIGYRVVIGADGTWTAFLGGD